MRRGDLLRRVGLCLLTMCVTTAAQARDGTPAPDPQSEGTVRKPTRAPARQWDAHLKALDGDRDGRVTFAEWDADDMSFDARDWDDDGILSGDELIAGAVCPAMPARTMAAGEDPYVVFERLDANHDDHLSKREFPGTAAAFAELDFNRDGLLSPLEFGVGR